MLTVVPKYLMHQKIVFKGLSRKLSQLKNSVWFQEGEKKALFIKIILIHLKYIIAIFIYVCYQVN